MFYLHELAQNIDFSLVKDALIALKTNLSLHFALSNNKKNPKNQKLICKY